MPMLLLASSGIGAVGQEAPRASLAGEASAAGQKTSIEGTHYNIKVGPVLVSLRGETDFELNDNINLAQVGRQSDLIVRPQLKVDARWQVTQLNTLNFDTTLGYAKYIDHSENDTKYLLASPGSALEFYMYVDDFRINLHDRFAYDQDPINVGVLSNVAQYGRFTNAAGVTVDWDLNDVILTFGYDYNTFLATTPQFNYLDSDGSTITSRASFIVNPTTKAGLQAIATITEYQQTFQNDNAMISLGPFVESQLTENTKITGTAGAQIGLFDKGGGNGDNNNLNGLYATVSLENRLNKFFTQSIDLGHNSDIGLTSNFYTTDFIRHHANWNIINHVSLSSQIFFEHVTESGGVIDETFNRFGGGITVGYEITQKLSASLGYSYTQKDSNTALRDYYQNSVILSMYYQF